MAGHHELNATAQSSLSELESCRELLDGEAVGGEDLRRLREHLASAQASTSQACAQYMAMLELGKSHSGHLKACLAEVDLLGRDAPPDEHDAETIDRALGLVRHAHRLGDRLAAQNQGVRFVCEVQDELRRLEVLLF